LGLYLEGHSRRKQAGVGASTSTVSKLVGVIDCRLTSCSSVHRSGVCACVMDSKTQDAQDTSRSRAESYGLAWMCHDCRWDCHGPRRIEPRRLGIFMEVCNGHLPPRFWSRYFDPLPLR